MGIYDVNAAIDKPNALNAFRQGQQYGNQLRQQNMQMQAQQQATDDRNQLRQLAPQIIAGDPNATSQAAAIDPDQTAKYQGAGDSQLRRLKGAISLIDSTPDARAKEAYYQQIRPYLSQNSPDGVEPPATFAEAEPQFMAAKARIAMLDAGTQGRVQSTYIDGDGNRVAIMADGQQKVLGANDAGMSQQTITVTGPDGRPRQMTFDKRTGGYMPAQEGGPSSALGSPPSQPYSQQAPAQAPQTVFESSGQQVQIDPSLPAEVRAAIAANPDAYGSAPDGSTARIGPQQGQPLPQAPASQGGLPPRLDYQNGGNSFVGQSPGEKAAQEATARAQVDLQYLPQTEAIKTQAAIAQAAGTQQAKQSAESKMEAQQGLPQVQANAQELTSLIDRLKAMPGLEDLTGISGYNPLNKIPGSAAMDANVVLDQIKGKSFLTAFQSLKGAGAITETEGRKATEAIARLNTQQSDDAMRASLDDLKQVVSQGLQRAQQKAQPQRRTSDQPAPDDRRRALLDKY